FESYQQMLEAFWDAKVDSDAEVQLVQALTELLLKTESIWAPISSLKAQKSVIDALCNKGVLEQQKKKIRFSHQTVQEFAIARLFEQSPDNSLSAFVEEHEAAIFSRRTVSAVLLHLRENDRDKYHDEVEAILSRQTRLHIVFLLIDFVCQQQNPTPKEVGHVKAFFQDDVRRLRVLIGINNKEQWFKALKTDSLPAAMKRSDIEQWPMLSVLSKAWSFDWDATLELVRDHWSQEQRNDNLTLRVMEHCGKWNPQTLEIVEPLAVRVKATQGYNYQNEKLISVISETSPAAAARLAARVVATDGPNTDGESPSRWNSALEQTKGWYELDAIVKRAPTEFLAEIAPWLLNTAETHHRGYSGSVLAHYAGNCMSLEDRDYPRESPILSAIQASIDLVSKSDPKRFVELSRPYWDSENAVIHRLYIEGLMNVVEECPEKAFEYLMGDNRRFSVSQHGDTQDSQSSALITKLFPHLDAAKREELTKRILEWTKYRDDVDLIDDQLVWDRESRLHLLTAIPSEYVSDSLATFIRDEKASLPNWDQEIQRAHSGWVKTIPPITEEEMATADDDELVEAFTKQSPGTSSWNQVEGGFEEQGGGEASAQQLAKMAESDHIAAGRIVKLLVKKGATANISRALEGFGKCDDREFIFELLNEVSPACDEIESFRESASRILLHSCDDDGLPEEQIELLSRWLNMPWDHTDSVVADGDNEKEWHPETSLLWTNLGSMILDTDRSYWTLVAVTHGLLSKNEPQGDRWMALLSVHLDREVSFKTWRMFCDRLRYVRGNGCTPSSAKALIAKLYDKFPTLASETIGCRLLAQLIRFLEPKFLRDVFHRLQASSSPLDQQAFGELLTLAALLDETSDWAHPNLSQELSLDVEPSEAFLVGASHAVLNLWNDLEKPSECSEILRQIFATGNSPAINASRFLFWNDVGLPLDENTRQLFGALEENVDAIDSGLAEEVLGEMVEILPETDRLPELRPQILSFCRRLVDARIDELKRREFNAYEVGPFLVEVAMTLQRFPDTRTGGLDLFEQLLRAGLDDADRALKDFDGTSGSSGSRREPRRRRRQRRRRATSS
ncbi:MAG: hypothetical protein AAGD07_24945, partial [Planctomycetota bacterium]